jgi:hypothetical protein
MIGFTIATLELIETLSDGSRIPLRIEIGQPRPHDHGGWACLVSVAGHDHYSRHIFGEDSLQALCLGLRTVRLHLELALARGSRLLDPGDETDFPLHAYFERLVDDGSLGVNCSREE